MSSLKKRISSFHKLGLFLKAFTKNNFKAIEYSILPINQPDIFNDAQNKLSEYIENSIYYNPWFTQDHIKYALNEWSKLLDENSLNNWVSNYNISDDFAAKEIGVVMAGNIPMVGFHDYLSVLISGNKLQAKLSTDDHKLIPLLHQILSAIDPEMSSSALFTSEPLKKIDAIIATGSNNTSRYFEYYFGKYPNIIRRNRNGVAILSGNETDSQLRALADDIFIYFGLGCRSISKLFVPKNYEFKQLFKQLESFQDYQYHTKYFNNYEYQKALYLVNKIHHRDNGFLLLKEDLSYASPISVLFYEEYENIDDVQFRLQNDRNLIQCVVGGEYLNFGESQKPGLNDYADGIDTLKFLLSLNK